ncbi:DUF7146 domain-containing protein [Nitrosomonas halophila]|uniref:Uncharacterized domain associated with phage/plasmid primase n=1 Tax=Nitrosomonas halophila TaxID=44576 RepID=A0A1H3M7A1_9PROT|nr:toprim domain-containing protein [Nitrosomonas halophila]SDY72463.1 Uncharacterized domain associated with phage/plasmid primase [Nitrosomonas halophila]
MNADQARELARGRWCAILITLAPPITPAFERAGRHVPCPVHGGKDGFRVFRDVNLSGGSICNTCGNFPDGFSTLMWINGWDFKTALQAVTDYLGTRHKSKPVARQSLLKHGREDEKLRQALNRVWKESISLHDDGAEPARCYLARRGIDLLPDNRVVRFHPSLPYFDGEHWVGDYPAMLALVSDTAGRPVTLHRTYLTKEGSKAPVESPRKLMRYPRNRTITGGAIRLNESDSSLLAIAEGLETALAVREGTDLPVWCVINAVLLEKFTPPVTTEKILIFADKDRPTARHPMGHGQEAARILVQRLWKMGIRVSLVMPEGEIPAGRKSLDWNDLLRQHGKQVFQPENVRATVA